MANEKPGILRNLRVKRVALVDVGANQDPITGDGAHIMLFKRHDVNKDGPGVGAVHVDSMDWRDDYEKATLDSADRNKLPDSAFAAVWTDAKGVKQRKLPIHDAGHLAAACGRVDGADIPADVKAAARRKIEATTKNKEKRMTPKALLQKMLSVFAEKDETKRAEGLALVTKSLDDLPDDDDVTKAHDPKSDMCKCADCMEKAKAKRFEGNAEVTKALEDISKAHKLEVDSLTKSNKALADAIEVEKNIRLDGEMVTLLKSFKATPFDLKEDVAKFRKMKEVAPEAFDRTITMLKATDAQLAASGVYKEFGSGMTSDSAITASAAWAQIEAKAEALVSKSATPMTKEVAIDKVMFDPANKALVKQYRDKAQA